MARDAWKARAAPWKRASIEAGMPSARREASMASTASPSEVPGVRLNEMVTAGNWPWWLTTRGLGRSSKDVNVESGTWPPVLERR